MREAIVPTWIERLLQFSVFEELIKKTGLQKSKNVVVRLQRHRAELPKTPTPSVGRDSK